MPSKSKAQQRYMGMVHACKKSDYKDCASKEVEDTARGMKAKDAKDFASTKHKGLPDKKEKNEMSGNSNLVTKSEGIMLSTPTLLKKLANNRKLERCEKMWNIL